MKGLAFLVLSLTLVCTGLGAEISLSGQGEVYLQVLPAIPYTSDRFHSPVNPENIYGIKDLTLGTEFTFKLTAGEGAGTLTLWLAVNPYDLAQLLLSAASGDPFEDIAVNEGLLVSDPAALSILRANVAWYIGQALVLRLGRQSMLTGYGYGWNPMDFANPVKNPFDPKAELRGVDALTFQVYLGNLFSLRLAGLFRFDDFTGTGDFKEVQAAAELNASFPAVELRLSGYYDRDGLRGEDPFAPALGAGFMLDLAGMGVYGEGGLLWGSRTWSAEGLSSLQRKQELIFSGLLGLEYTFASELRIISEYFYNGEGYSRPERRLYEESLQDRYLNLGYLPGEYLTMYRPGYFSRHYLLLNLAYPFYAWKLNTELSTYFSPDSWALGIMPAVELEVSGSLSVRASYMAMISLGRNQYNEARLSPMKHVFELRGTHFF